ncbi:MAG: hypothetical protein IKR01_05250, partial [Spirochaetales bacterium]|nr:hypothetical protein [Spirochaetales bacterium]
MKKAITILAIIAIVACAVFADTVENHKIQIKTKVEGFAPVFQLYYSDSIKTNATRTDTARTAPATAEGNDFTNKNEANAYTASMIDKTAVDISKNPVTATFVAKLAGN